MLLLCVRVTIVEVQRYDENIPRIELNWPTGRMAALFVGANDVMVPIVSFEITTNIATTEQDSSPNQHQTQTVAKHQSHPQLMSTRVALAGTFIS
jgi:hypothetical protein